MCGIVGYLNLDGERPAEAGRISAMCDTIVHRGPNDQGVMTDGPVGLGMRRLAIIDVASGRQPISNEDGRIWVVFNGEIFNYVELRAELETRGHRFATHCDTEVLGLARQGHERVGMGESGRLHGEAERARSGGRHAVDRSVVDRPLRHARAWG